MGITKSLGKRSFSDRLLGRGMTKSINNKAISSMLQRVWLQQLHQEYCDICYSYATEMVPPVFEISESVKTLGSWDGETRTLRLSSYLILNYPWSTTLQVLKHEMAHQLCTELLHSGRKPHGEDFQMACDKLGVLPAFRRSVHLSCATVDETTFDKDFSANGRRFVDKVEKLLALARSANEYEATLAMQKANELIEKHNILCREKGWKLNYTCATIDRKRKRIERYQRHICMILRDFFYVRTVLSRLYDPACNETYKVIDIFGTDENVAIAEYCYHFLENRLMFLWLQNKHQFNGSVRAEKNSYYLGLLKGFYEKLDNHRQAAGKNSKVTVAADGAGELILTEDKRLTEFIGLTFPRLRTVSYKKATVYGDTFREGVREGKTITLAKGVTDRSCASGKLLQ